MDESKQQKYKVLLVEDSSSVAELLEAMLLKAKNAAFEISRADCLEKTLGFLSRETPDIILLDLSLPDSQGFDTFARVHEAGGDVPVIILTGTDDAELATRAVREGAQDYIVKGAIDINSLVRDIRYAIERQRVEKELRMARDELEKRVQERTAELEKSNLDLKKEIEERKKAEQDLTVAHTKLKETQSQLIQAAKMQVVGGLASGVAHEVKNPLAIILQGVEYLSKKLPADDKNISLTLEYITNAVERADTIVRGLMDFASISQLNMVSQKLTPILDKALMLLKHKLDKNHVQLKKDFPENLPELEIDGNKIEQVFLNLFMNAIDAMPDSGVLSVRQYIKQSAAEAADPEKAGADRLVVEVSDTGSGISEEALKRIFDPFFTTKRAKGGTGLGLSIVKNILQMHNAEINIANKPEGGTMVTVEFLR